MTFDKFKNLIVTQLCKLAISQRTTQLTEDPQGLSGLLDTFPYYQFLTR